jgi:hypothetical protein
MKPVASLSRFAGPMPGPWFSLFSLSFSHANSAVGAITDRFSDSASGQGQDLDDSPGVTRETETSPTRRRLGGFWFGGAIEGMRASAVERWDGAKAPWLQWPALDRHGPWWPCREAVSDHLGRAAPSVVAASMFAGEEGRRSSPAAGAHQHPKKKKAVASIGSRLSPPHPPPSLGSCSWSVRVSVLVPVRCPVRPQPCGPVSRRPAHLPPTAAHRASRRRVVLVAITTAYPAPPSLSRFRRPQTYLGTLGRLGHSHSHTHSPPFHHHLDSGPCLLRARST